MDLLSGVVCASVGAEENTQAGFFQDLYVVVICITHRPAGAMPPSFLAIRPVHQTHVAVHPIVELVVTAHLIKFNQIILC